MTRDNTPVPKEAIWVGLVFAGAGIAILIACVSATLESLRFTRDAVDATGTVVAFRKVSPKSTTLGWAPVVRFRDAEGQELDIVGDIASNPPSYAIGDRVGLLYLPGDPRHAHLDSFASRWLGPLVLFTMG